MALVRRGPFTSIQMMTMKQSVKSETNITIPKSKLALPIAGRDHIQGSIDAAITILEYGEPTTQAYEACKRKAKIVAPTFRTRPRAGIFNRCSRAFDAVAAAEDSRLLQTSPGLAGDKSRICRVLLLFRCHPGFAPDWMPTMHSRREPRRHQINSRSCGRSPAFADRTFRRSPSNTIDWTQKIR